MKSGSTVHRPQIRWRVVAVVTAAALVLPGWADARIKRGAMRGAIAAREERLLSDPAAALRAARKAQDAGKLERAAKLLREVSKRHPVVSSHADWMRAEIALAKGDPVRSRQIAAAALAREPDPLVESRLYASLGAAEAAVGNDGAAREAWKQALARPHSLEDRPGLFLAVASSLEAAGLLAEAQAEYLHLWTQRPLSKQADVADARLDILAEQLGEEVRGPKASYQRAESLLRANRNTLALAAYEATLAKEPSDRLRRRTGRKRANTLFRMRKYEEAIEAYADLPQTSQTRIAVARARARSGDVDGAIKALKEIAKAAGKRRPQRALYLAALLLEDEEGREAEADPLFRELSAPRNAGKIRNEATWHLGWRAYRQGRYREAIERFDELAGYQESLVARLRPRYWRARALEKLGDPAAAREFFALAAEYPLTYYGWRASSREQDDVPLAERVPPSREEAEDQLAASDFERARILARAGFPEEAGGEIARLSTSARGIADRIAIADLYRDAGLHHAAQSWILGAYLEELARGPEPGRESLWWHAWPLAYQREVVRASRRFEQVEPELVFAVMREESGYRPAAVSPSGARGLLQIMEETGSRLAQQEGSPEPFDADQLFDPTTNIALGTRYLAQLREQFDGRLALTIASYNAGPTAVDAWLEAGAPVEDEDEWVESIPYEQTRNYVKRVLLSMNAYRLIY